MNRKEAAEIAAYSAAVMFYKANAIMCHLMPGDTFSFPHSPEAKYIAGKSCWYRREDGTGPAYRTGRLAAVLLISHASHAQN